MKYLTRARLLASVAIAAGCLLLALAFALLIDFRPPPAGNRSVFVRFWDPAESGIFFRLHLSRVLASAVIGAGLACAGCAFQAALRNPLAEPFTLGVSSGSALAAVLAIRFGVEDWLGYGGVGLSALAGASLTVYIVWRLGRVGRALPPATLLLGGVTVAMFCSAASMFIQYTADYSEVYRIVQWMMGGLGAVRYPSLAGASAAILLGMAVLFALARHFNALSAGADAAASVGVAPGRTTTLALFAASLVVGTSISIAGPIGFVGLIVPHALRALVGPDHRVLLPTAACGGAAMLVLCDFVASQLRMPVGIITALLGGPFFLFLLRREKTRGAMWGG